MKRSNALFLSLAITLLVALNISLLSTTASTPLQVSFESPEKVTINRAFQIIIKVDSTDEFDVKVFIHNSEDDKVGQKEYISETLSNSWQRSWLYLPSSLPNKKEFSVRALSSPGNRKICVKLRRTNTQTTYESCNPIEIQENGLQLQTESRDPITQKIDLNPSKNEAKKEITTKQGKIKAGILYLFTLFLVIIIILLALKRL